MSRTRESPRARHRGRVFIIGAGVSASCGIAVANLILREAVVRMERITSEQSGRIHQLLRYLYPNFDRRLRNYPNIEDFLNLLEMARRFNTEEFITSATWSRLKLNEARKTTLKAVTDYIWDLMADKSRQQAVRDFVRDYLRKGDTIVTFNWDLTMERALEECPGDPGFLYTYSRHREEKSFSLLKPHGSIDWFEKKTISGLVSESDVGKLDKTLWYYPQFDRSKNPQLTDVAPVIVPPVATKEFEFDFLKRVWRHIYRAISDATEVHILGYSLPREDQFARLVFRRAIRNNILRASKRNEQPASVVVINPDPNAEGTFSRLVGRDVKDFDFRQAYFEDYVASLQE